MLIYFKKEKRSTTRYYKNKIEKYYNCQFPRIQTYKDEFKKKKSVNKKKSKKAKWQKKSGEVNKTHEREVMRTR
jgi:hypothetical protein